MTGNRDEFTEFRALGLRESLWGGSGLGFRAYGG